MRWLFLGLAMVWPADCGDEMACNRVVAIDLKLDKLIVSPGDTLTPRVVWTDDGGGTPCPQIIEWTWGQDPGFVAPWPDPPGSVTAPAYAGTQYTNPGTVPTVADGTYYIEATVAYAVGGYPNPPTQRHTVRHEFTILGAIPPTIQPKDIRVFVEDGIYFRPKEERFRVFIEWTGSDSPLPGLLWNCRAYWDQVPYQGPPSYTGISNNTEPPVPGVNDIRGPGDGTTRNITYEELVTGPVLLEDKFLGPEPDQFWGWYDGLYRLEAALIMTNPPGPPIIYPSTHREIEFGDVPPEAPPPDHTTQPARGSLLSGPTGANLTAGPAASTVAGATTPGTLSAGPAKSSLLTLPAEGLLRTSPARGEIRTEVSKDAR